MSHHMIPFAIFCWVIGGITGFIIGSCPHRKAAFVGIAWMIVLGVILIGATWERAT